MSHAARFYLFMGSGGVGKTTLSAAWALALAQQGLRVALITIDPAKRLAQSLGLNQLEGRLTQTTISDHLWAMMLDQESTSYRLVERFTTTPEQAQKIIHNHYFKVFSRFLSGTHEMMAVYEVYEALYDGRFDAVVLDTPPAQHALDFLEVPQRLSHALDGQALRWLIDQEFALQESASGWRARLGGLGKTVALKAFTKVTSTPFIEDLLEFISLFGEVLMQLKTRGGSLEKLLKSPSTDLWIVTSPQHPQLTAAQQVTDILRARGYSVSGWLINRTPLIVHDMVKQKSGAGDFQLNRVEPQLIDQLYTSGVKELSESLRTQVPSVKEQALQAWLMEIEKSRCTLRSLQMMSETHQKVILIEELLFDLTPLKRLESLARSLENQLKDSINPAQQGLT